MAHPLKAERQWQIWSEIVFISICHQANWDRLHDRIIDIASKDVCELQPSELCKLTSKRFIELFANGLDPDRLKVKERLKLLRELGRKALGWPNGVGLSWLNDEHVSLSGHEGIYSWLNNIPVFSADPIQKKARVLVHQLLRYGLIKVTDPEHISPAVDYHLIRLYVRTARVRPANDEWEQRLKEGGKARVEPVTALRRAVEEAMYYTATGAELRVDELNHIEWQIARSFCLRENPRCYAGPLIEKPVDSTVSALSCKTGCTCPLRMECLGARDAQVREVLDPQSAKSYY
jgi:hypothetical protein